MYFNGDHEESSNATPADNLKTYPVYRPDREPPGYWEWLQKQKPQPLEPGKIRNREDWISAQARSRSGASTTSTFARTIQSTLPVDARLNSGVLDSIQLPAPTFLAQDDEASRFLARRRHASSFNVKSLDDGQSYVRPNKP